MNPETNNGTTTSNTGAPTNSNSNSNSSSQAASKNIGMAVLAYLGILIIIPFVTDAKNDPYVKFHLGQGLTLIILFVVGWIIGMVPVLGWIVSFIITIIGIVLCIIGIVNAATGKEKQLPIIGKYASHFKF